MISSHGCVKLVFEATPGFSKAKGERIFQIKEIVGTKAGKCKRNLRKKRTPSSEHIILQLIS